MRLVHRNMAAGTLRGAFSQMATAFAESFALLPVFLKEFTTSNLLVLPSVLFRPDVFSRS